MRWYLPADFKPASGRIFTGQCLRLVIAVAAESFSKQMTLNPDLDLSKADSGIWHRCFYTQLYSPIGSRKRQENANKNTTKCKL